jgi:ADP-heptose:LPS heptosyltransferase
MARPDHLGDVLLTLPSVAALRAALPEAHIGFLLETSIAPVARRCPDIDETFALPYPPLAPGTGGHDWAEVVSGAARALRDRFDLILLSRPRDPWSGELAVAAGIPIRLGYAMPETERFLTHAVPLREEAHAVIHTLRLAQQAARCLGLSPAGRAALDNRVRSQAPVRLIPTPRDEALASHVLSGVPSAAARPIVFHPGSGWPLKNWAAERWGQLGIAIQRRWGVTPLVSGGSGETALVHAVVASSQGSCVGLAGRLSIGALAALYRRSSLVISIDSGPLHLAAMVGARVIGLYGPLSPAQWSPWCPAERQRIVRVPIACSPCDCIFDPPCGIPLQPPCMTGITVEAVLAAAANLLDSGGNGCVTEASTPSPPP